jgi:hypothetical protein
VRLVRVERVEGAEPVKRLEKRSREDNVMRPPRAEGMAPAIWLLEKERYVSFDKPLISEGIDPVKLFEFNDNEITSPAPEQLTPVHEHLLDTSTQIHSDS